MYVEVSPCPSHGFFTVHTPFSERQEFRVQSLFELTNSKPTLSWPYISRVPSEQRR